MQSTPPLRGRDAELDAIAGALALAGAGAGSVVLIEAPPGFGKTRLLAEAAEMADARGFRVGAATAPRSDDLTPMASLVAALFTGREPLLDPAVLRGLDLRPEARYWLLDEIEALLEQTSRDRPVLICLDDQQRADAATLAALEVLPARLRASPIVWTIAARGGEAGPGLRRMTQRLARDGAVRLRLGVLDDDAVRLVIEDAVGAASTDVLAMADRAGGCPFLLVELLAGQREEGRVTIDAGIASLVDVGLPRRIADSVERRLERLSAVAVRAARAGAVLGATFSVGELTTMLSMPAASLVDPVDELLRADLLVERGDRLAFGHDLLRDGVLDTLPSGGMRDLERRAADVLLNGGSAPMEVAARLAASSDVGDGDAAATLVAAAGAVAAAQPSAAADLGLQALRLVLPEDEARGELVSAVALWLHAAGRLDEGRALVDGALHETLAASEEGQVRLSIAGMLSLSPDERARAGRAALEIPGLPQELRAAHLARLVHNLVVAGRGADADALVEDARAAAATAPGGVTFTLDLADVARAYAADRFTVAAREVQRIADRAVGGTEDARSRLADQWVAEALAVADDFDGALAVTRDGMRAAQQDGRVWTVRAWEAWRGRLLLQSGQIADASAALQGVLGPGEDLDLENLAEASAAFAWGRIALYTGDADAARAARAFAVRTYATAWPELKRHAAWMLALQADGRGDPVAARDVLMEGADVGTTILPLLARDVTDEVRVARIAVAAGDPDLGRWALDVAARRATLNPGIASIAGVAAHTRGLVEGDADALAHAVHELARSPRPLALASAVEDAGAAALAGGDRPAAIAAFGRALELTTHAGATVDARRLRQRLRALGVRRRIARGARVTRGWPALTSSEAVVARLVADGLTNRAVADRLVVSPHTVSMHLRSVFEKLGISSRRDLPTHVPHEDRATG